MPILTKGVDMLAGSDFEDAMLAGLVSHRSVLRRGGRLHASSSGFCPRRNALHAHVDQLARMGPSGELYTSIGNAVHEALQKALDVAGLLWKAEYHLLPIELEDGTLLNLGGYIDGVVEFEGKVYLVEFKSCSPNMPNDVRKSHRRQAEIYSSVVGLPIKVVYQSRNVTTFGRGRPDIRTFDIPYNPEVAREVFTILAQSTRYNQVGHVPSRPMYMKKSMCDKTYCPFMSRCWPEMDDDDVVPATAEEMIETIELSQKDADFLVRTTDQRRHDFFDDLASGTGEGRAMVALATKPWESFV